MGARKMERPAYAEVRRPEKRAQRGGEPGATPRPQRGHKLVSEADHRVRWGAVAALGAGRGPEQVPRGLRHRCDTEGEGGGHEGEVPGLREGDQPSRGVPGRVEAPAGVVAGD